MLKTIPALVPPPGSRSRRSWTFTVWATFFGPCSGGNPPSLETTTTRQESWTENGQLSTRLGTRNLCRWARTTGIYGMWYVVTVVAWNSANSVVSFTSRFAVRRRTKTLKKSKVDTGDAWNFTYFEVLAEACICRLE